MVLYFLIVHILCHNTIFSFFFFNDTATTEIYTLSLHDALPIFVPRGGCGILPRSRRRDAWESGVDGEREEQYLRQSDPGARAGKFAGLLHEGLWRSGDRGSPVSPSGA